MRINRCLVVMDSEFVICLEHVVAAVAVEAVEAIGVVVEEMMHTARREVSGK
jgi:hypothetical protein